MEGPGCLSTHPPMCPPVRSLRAGGQIKNGEAMTDTLLQKQFWDPWSFFLHFIIFQV